MARLWSEKIVRKEASARDQLLKKAIIEHRLCKAAGGTNGTWYQWYHASTSTILRLSPRSPALLFADAERPTIERRDGEI